MIYTNEDILNIKYNERLDRIQIRKRKGTSNIIKRFLKCIKSNKIISISIMLFIIFSTINFYLIYNVFKLVQTINFM